MFGMFSRPCAYMINNRGECIAFSGAVCMAKSITHFPCPFRMNITHQSFLLLILEDVGDWRRSI